MKIRPVFAVIVIAFISFSPASAQVGDTTKLGTVIISASKNPATRTSVTQSVTVITGEELRSRGIARVSDALRAVPGVAMVQNGATGSVNSLFLRGGESRYTKVLIDGVAVNAPGGFFDFSHLTTDNVERIEIVRGPASVVYGADAVTGIVQIFTRQGTGPLGVVAEARGGTYGTREASVEAAGSAERVRYSLGGAARRTDGILAFNNQYYNGTLSGSGSFAPRDGSRITLTSRYTAAEFHYPTDFTGAPVDSNAYRVQHRFTAGLDAKSQLSRDVTAILRAGTNYVSDLTEDIAIPFGAPVPLHSELMSRNRRRTVETGIAARLPGEATLNVGAEHLRESERSVNAEGPVGAPASPTSRFAARRSNNAGYAELTGSIAERASYTLAARHDDNSEYDGYTTYRAGFNASIRASTRLRGSVSTAFNAPAFNQLRPTLYTVGSPDLKPERARAWELGAEESIARAVVVSAVYFQQRFSDLIQFVNGGPPNFLGSYANLTEAESNGFELEASVLPVRNWSATASYAMSRPRVSRVSSEYEGSLKPGDALLRRPTHSGNASVTWSRSDVASAAVSVAYVGSRPDMDFSQFPSPVVTLPAYARVDLSGSRDVLRFGQGRSSLAITARVENALDSDYEDVLNFTAPGRTVLIGARFRGSL